MDSVCYIAPHFSKSTVKKTYNYHGKLKWLLTEGGRVDVLSRVVTFLSKISSPHMQLV